MKKGINVLSLFGGIECGMIAMKELGIEVNQYFSSEINKFPMKASSDNFPDIIHVGSVTELTYEKGSLSCEIPFAISDHFNEINLIIGGPPCQEHSIAGNRKGLEGTTGKMVLEFLRIYHEVKKHNDENGLELQFLMENVPGMKQDVRDIISASLGVQPRLIHSSLTGAQNRKRLYWTNIPGYKDPEDRGIVLRDILEDIPLDDPRWKPLPEKYREQVEASMHRFGIFQIGRGKNAGGMKGDGKISTINASKFQDNNFLVAEKARCITASYVNAGPADIPRDRRTLVLCNTHPSGKGQNGNVHSIDGLAPTITTNKGEGPKVSDGYYYRKLTVRECARAQNIPEWYSFDTLSDSQAYKGIGNGWDIEPIKNLLRPLLIINKQSNE